MSKELNEVWEQLSHQVKNINEIKQKATIKFELKKTIKKELSQWKV